MIRCPRSLSASPLSERAFGFEVTIAAFLLWGTLPAYFGLINTNVSPWEILAHRVLWSVVILGLITLVLGRMARLRAVFTSIKMVGALAVTAILVALNWGVFIWAVVNGHVIDASLGYFINPLLNIAFGFVFLGERMKRLQWLAVVIAATGVGYSIVAYGQVPWIGLILATCFGLYGLMRKQLPVDSMTGLLVETILLLPIALAELIWLHVQGNAHFLAGGWQTDLFLVGCGGMTIVPFTLFASGVRRLRLGSIGIMQYITPTLQFLSGVLLFHESMSMANLVAFGCIWIALGVYSIGLLDTRQHTLQKV